jgi:hypothetical protein
MKALTTITATLILSLSLTGPVNARNFQMFTLDYEGCYDRATDKSTFVVDSHLHFQPFGGPAIDFDKLLDMVLAEEVYFVNAYGIGQKLPSKSSCTYYLNCPGTPVTPSITNDIVNAANIAKRLPNNLPEDIHITLSMSFTDLSEPESVVPQMELLDKEFPNMFTWMGEINVAKQAIFPNGHYAVPKQEISRWKDFMAVTAARNIPVSLHSDLGNNKNPTKYLDLMEEILLQYPGNIIVWHHMGLSAELTDIGAKQHIKILKRLLDEYPHLYIDMTWRVLYDNVFSDEKKRPRYIKFLNEYSSRFLPGTDFVASADKPDERYREEVEVNSDILKDLDDTAFRNIALGQNYFNLLALPYKAPTVCGTQ